MDKKTVIIVVVLGLLVIFWIPIMTFLGFIEAPKPQPQTETQEQTEPQAQPTPDTARQVQPEQVAQPPSTPSKMPARDSSLVANIDQPEPFANVTPETLFVETKLWSMVLVTTGGGPVSMQLKDYSYYHSDSLVQMLPDCKTPSPEFIFNSGNFRTNRLVYEAQPGPGTYRVTNNPLEITFRHVADHGGTITKTYRFYPDRYDFDLLISGDNVQPFNFDNEYVLNWENSFVPTEPNASDDYKNFWAMAQMGTEREKYDDYDDNKFSITHDGETRWIAKKTKFFTAVLAPLGDYGTAAIARGRKYQVTIDGESVEARSLEIGMKMALPYAPSFADSFSVYVGPVDYERLRAFNPEVPEILDIGTTPYVGWIVKLFAVPIMWILPKMYTVIPNYGFVIIIFALMVKLVTLPLSKRMVRSMSAMKDLQPKMEELKKKHKNNPQALNREMMKLYKEAGVNPLSGCLPYLPQLPLFYAMFAVFRSTILLRQAPFIFWWDDLSRGAQSITDPYIILVLLMVVLMFVQQKMTMSDPKNKALTYLMPLIFGFFFYRASAGLVLYWTSFSFFSWLEQLVFKRPTPGATPATAEVQAGNPGGKKKK